jgi:hypothetical protein
LSYARQNNLRRKQAAKNTETQRHLRNARRARLEEAQTIIDRAIDYGRDKSNGLANGRITDAQVTLQQAEAICDLIVEQE